jgi:hypothetical protein
MSSAMIMELKLGVHLTHRQVDLALCCAVLYPYHLMIDRAHYLYKHLVRLG